MLIKFDFLILYFKSKIRGRGNFMWISQTEIEDEDCLEMLSKLNLNRQIQDEKLENNSITKVKLSN